MSATTSAPPAATEAPAPERIGALTSVVSRFLPLTAPVVLIVVFFIATPVFLTSGNLLLMGSQAGVLLLPAVGLTVVVLTGSFDLSVGSVFLLAGAVLAALAERGVPEWTAVAAALATAVAAGTTNGLLFVYGRVPSFVVTLGTLSVWTGVALIVIGNGAVGFSAPGLLDVANGEYVPWIPNALLIGLLVWGALLYLLRRTRFGLYAYAIGGNERVARLSGIRADVIKVAAFAVAGLATGLGGVIAGSQLQGAGSSLGASVMLDAVAALAVGGTALSGGKGGVERTILGVVTLIVLSNGLNLLGVADYTQILVKGAVVIVAAVFTLSRVRGDIVK